MKANVKLYKFVLLLVAFQFPVFVPAQDNSPQPPMEKEWVIKPKLGVGYGVLSYYGDLKPPKGSRNPLISNRVFHINAAQPLNDFLELNFSMMFGTLGADERTLERNLNFRSNITSGGLNVSYNFSHLLPADHVIEPFFSLGIEAFEFLSKTDRYDQFGNEYHYWSDGSIRNIPESEENVGSAMVISRDYVFETDIRSMNADGFGDYSEHSFGIPVGAGVNFLVNPKLEFKVGAEYHWTFTDFIDGISSESRGIRQGNRSPDRFLHGFLRLSYNLTEFPKAETPDFLVDASLDSDMDSIADFLDDCPDTPLGIEVDTKGCPLDSDNDGVADYRDMEPQSPSGAVVDSAGVALTDEEIEQMYLAFREGTGQSQYTNTTYAMETAERRTTRRAKPTYSVKIAEFEDSMSDSLAAELLSMPDIVTRQTDEGTTIVEAGNIPTLSEAVERKVELESSGIETGDVTEKAVTGKTERVTSIELDAVSKESTGLTVDQAIAKNKALPPPSKLILDKGNYTLDRPIDERSVAQADDKGYEGKTVYRVQIGAFANKLSKDVYGSMEDLLVITTNDGLTRYYTGAYTSYEAAANKKLDMIGAGYKDAYVVPFKDGKQLTLKEAGATEITGSAPQGPLPVEQADANVRFKVELGAYKSQIPTEVLDSMMELGKIEQHEGEDGAVHYFTGDFDTFEEAETFAEELRTKGFENATVIGDQGGNIIPASEAQKLIKE